MKSHAQLKEYAIKQGCKEVAETLDAYSRQILALSRRIRRSIYRRTDIQVAAQIRELRGRRRRAVDSPLTRAFIDGCVFMGEWVVDPKTAPMVLLRTMTERPSDAATTPMEMAKNSIIAYADQLRFCEDESERELLMARLNASFKTYYSIKDHMRGGAE